MGCGAAGPMLVDRVGRWLGGLNVYAVAGVEQVLTEMVGGWLVGQA